jgi:hypothetical protein
MPRDKDLNRVVRRLMDSSGQRCTRARERLRARRHRQVRLRIAGARLDAVPA